MKQDDQGDQGDANAAVRVSICCITYNHAPYLADALQGFLNQKTDFPYEILIHDDASTDGTREVLEEYEARYPKRLRVLYEEHNRYHEINDYLVDIFIPIARGEYLAFCEGDDYWISDRKLQRQYDFLEAHPDYSFFFHNAVIDDYDAELKYRSSPETKDRDRSLDELITSGGGLANCTGSFFFRKSALENPPPFLRIAAVGDYPWMFTLGLRGKVYWAADPMLVYRNGQPGSWTANNRSSPQDRVRRSTNSLATMEQFEVDTKGAYTVSAQKRIAEIREALDYDSKLLAAQERKLSLGALWMDGTSNLKRKLRFSLARILSPALHEKLTDALDERALRSRRTPAALREDAYCERLISGYRDSQA
jgi:glycosyltransferase involved in cell wall biosynthesis